MKMKLGPIFGAMLLVSVAAPSSATVYIVNRAVGSGSVVGSITTDDTLGVIQWSNITAYTLNLTTANGSETLTKADGNPFSAIYGSAFTATTSGLFFDFSRAGAHGVAFLNSSSSASYCIQTSGCFDFQGAGESVRVNYFDQIVRERGIEQIASAVTAAVPEPATWAMMMLGFGAMGFTMRRQKVTTRIRFA